MEKTSLLAFGTAAALGCIEMSAGHRTSPETNDNATASRWEEVVSLFRRMCQTEQRRVEDAYTLHELSALHWQEELIPSLARTLGQEMRAAMREQFALQSAQEAAAAPDFAPPRYRPRVAFDDIPGVIDLIVAEEQRDAILNSHLAA
jgi:hypothetical protein